MGVAVGPSTVAGGVPGWWGLRGGRRGVAVRILREEWRRQPSLRAADALGWALHRAGEDKGALRYTMRATDKAQGGEVRSARYVFHRGEIEQALGLSASARRHLAEAGRINPRFARVGKGEDA